MQLLSWVISLVLLSSLLHAETDKYSVEEFLHVRFEGREALKVLESLDLPMGSMSEGKGKTFQTNDGSLELSCFSRHYNVEPYACHFTFDLRGLSKEVTQKADAKGLRLVLNNPNTSEKLFNALLVPVYVMDNKEMKILEIDNGEVIIDCRRQLRGARVSTECSVFTTLN